ncbi:hypothetical protein ACFSKI_12655 [Pseudogracilibacillus auburnensis]|uniref:Uncharacterized protein n=1 Tax=Pseudogracilibacillus auburnensis TaxID=1494959 RepID=A0A2V3WB07_9BACI|nr:hypothetical protein [Pseudogracilibacillus auburnensis]MBO1003656.1 hypothetical protein [Pseudogracilibacillus auburnensis]PXW90334.1 hypothetical protein DFR56_101246 [Pseudogracilibacillus auburnensis]
MFKRMMIVIFFSCILFIFGCNGQDKNWRQNGSVSVADVDYIGAEASFGITKINGDPNEPHFLKDQGRLYQLSFFDHTDQLVGKTYTLIATHEDTGKIVELYKDEIQGENAAKIGFDERGFWTIDVMIDEEVYTSFVIEVV